MRLQIVGKDITKEDLVGIGKFFVKFFKDREDVIGMFFSEGTEDLSKEECAKLIESMFEGNKGYTKIIE